MSLRKALLILTLALTCAALVRIIAPAAALHTVKSQSQARSHSTVPEPNAVMHTGDGTSANSMATPVTGKLPASAANVQLSTSMAWMFGSKEQHGWIIYAPLISRIVGTESGIGSDDFARSVSKWQSSKGLPATGILDADTWSAMIRMLQSQRIKERDYPSADQLVTVPASEFWDTARPVELRQVERDAYTAYTRMMAAAAADPALRLQTSEGATLSQNERYLRIISAFRPREYQEQLRRQSPHADRAGLAVNSPHFTGRALDLYVGGEPVSTKDDNRLLQTRTPVYRWLVKNAAKYGFRPYFYEPWHWEYCAAEASPARSAR